MRSRWLVLPLFLSLACTGSVDDAAPGLGGGGESGAGAGRGGQIGAGAASGSGAAVGGAAVDCNSVNPPATTRLVRLTHRQYDNTVRDLTGLDLKLAQEFLADQRQAGFDRGLDLQVGETLGKAYRSAAETVAAQVAAGSAFSKVVGCDPALGDACAKTFIGDFGKKAYRRPLTAAESEAYLQLFKRAGDLVETGDAFHKGVQLTLEALLQSPKFLYRTELSNQAQAGLVALNGYEIATRLSYMIVNTMPDAELLAAAESGALAKADGVASQASRLAKSVGARETVSDFHHQWLDLDVYPNKLTKDAQKYPTVNPDLAPVLQQEVERFIEDVTFESQRGFATLFSAPFTYVNATTAKLYGVNGSFGTALTRADLDPTRRAGLLTQLGFLATHAFSGQSSPIHRGVFIQRRILCSSLPDPPPNIPELPPLDGSKIKTTRQQVDQHTAPSECAGCHHGLINPVGFGLENYDAVGQFRTEENGYPIDASGTLVGTQGNAAFSNGVELARAVAQSPEARLCYAKNWLRYGFGRAETPADTCELAAIASALADDSRVATSVLKDLSVTKAFRYRTSEAP